MEIALELNAKMNVYSTYIKIYIIYKFLQRVSGLIYNKEWWKKNVVSISGQVVTCGS